jgi:predicted metal-dependent peptidase
MTSIPVPPVLDKALSRLLLDHPFFAVQALNTPIIMTTDVKIAATNGAVLKFNPNWVAENAVIGHISCVLAHEVSHNAFLHGERMQWRDPVIWNYATDYEINGMLHDQGFRPPPCGWLYNAKYSGMSAEKIYDDLVQQMSKNPQGGGSGQGGDGDDDGQSGQLPSNPLHGDLEPTAGAGEPAKRADTVRKMRQRVATAANQARMMGKLKGELARMVNEVVQPKVPWPEVLREFLMRIAKDDESWARRNRRFSHVYLPARHSEAMGPIVIIGDSSGSIWCSPKELEQFASEIQAVSDLVQPEHIRLIWADTKVAGERVFERGEKLVFDVQGGGGTDMRVPLKYVEQYDPEAVILLTDGYTPWPSQEPPYPLIVCCSTDIDVPVGSVVRL